MTPLESVVYERLYAEVEDIEATGVIMTLRDWFGVSTALLRLAYECVQRGRRMRPTQVTSGASIAWSAQAVMSIGNSLDRVDERERAVLS